MADMSPVNIAWVAGIVEGEGWIGHDKRSVTPKIKVHMTDEDVVRRLHSVTGIGKVYGPIVLPSGKDSYVWRVERPDHAAGLLMTLSAFLGERRFKRAKETLWLWANNKRIGSRARRTSCLRGHSLLDESNLMRMANPDLRKCKACARIRQQAYKERQRGR